MVSSDSYAQAEGYDLDETMTRWTSTELWKGLHAVQADEVHRRIPTATSKGRNRTSMAPPSSGNILRGLVRSP